MKEKAIILASASPRRKELLALMGLTFRVVPSRKEEIAEGDTPAHIVEHLSRQKAEDVASGLQEQDALVIGADTIVVCDGTVMGKPRTEEEAFAMLSRLQGKTHEVYTGVTLVCVEGMDKTCETFSRKASVTVHPMEDAEIWEYIRKGESLDKAGGYGIQGSFAMYVDALQGEYNTVLGLPIAGLYQALKKYRQEGKGSFSLPSGVCI